MNYRLTTHARDRMQQGNISEELVRRTIENPEARVHDESSKFIYQRIFERPDGKRFMLRVVVDEEQHPASVVTLYAASRYHRYMR